MSTIFWIIVLVVIAAGLVVLAAAFYVRASNEVSLVRTGAGGRRVVIDGGALALPYFHEVARVNMQTLRLDVQRRGEAALITRDRLRVDVGAEFYVSVPPEPEAIVAAAQTLGRRSFRPDELKALIEGMLVDALRGVAARLTMDELHEGRAEFVAAVREGLVASLARYGLRIDSVSLTALDQTPFAALDENNAFNAVGMRKLAEVVAKSKKERAEIEGETAVSVRRAAMEAARRRLEIDLDERRAEIAQAQEIEAALAAQMVEVARRKAEAEQAAAAARIAMEEAIQAAEIARDQALQQAEIAREQAIREAEIARARALEVAEQERAIEVAAKSRDESRALAEADMARVELVRAQEAVETARASAEAERRRDLGLIAAAAEAEAAAQRALIAAKSAREAAAERTEQARLEAEAMRAAKAAETEALRARIEAENARSEAVLAYQAEIARLEAMPKVVAEMVKPAEKIGSINVTQVGSVDGSRGAILQALDSVLEQAVHAPSLHRLVERIGEDIREGEFDKRRRRRED
jgi:uncharacterized membrane protein YqiK